MNTKEQDKLWRTAEGKVIHVKDMETTHIVNSMGPINRIFLKRTKMTKQRIVIKTNGIVKVSILPTLAIDSNSFELPNDVSEIPIS